ncbi:hypothetical protein [Anaerosporobacter faecicola]|uniref:hypothetical protein n=1 Tax=Anaerosporobacter faecicola TaxID=2718714 RepID=UPI001439C7EC|nr:hypothetical protein [Anaerosporobacter faecicola]
MRNRIGLLKSKKSVLLLCTVSFVAILIICIICINRTKSLETSKHTEKNNGMIYLYGEEHGVEKILDRELELWCDYYNKYNMRHLFLEIPYYAAAYLNLWMKADNDTILDQLFTDWEGTASDNSSSKAFYKKLKEECPETIFHGTDVGHQFDTMGTRYLKYLANNKKYNSDEYKHTQHIIDQGRKFYSKEDHVYRENKMVENFIKEYEQLQGESIMGIYGAAHTGLDSLDYMTNTVPCMANQLKETYGEQLYTEDLSSLAKVMEPIKVEQIEVEGKMYSASYYGKQDLTGFKDFSYREVWRLEDSYDTFKNCKKTGNVLPYNNYQMLIEEGQVFVIDYIRTNGKKTREYHRSDGTEWNGQLVTEEFLIN